MFLAERVHMYLQKVNGCRILSPGGKAHDFPFCTDIIYYNIQNQLGFEFDDVFIRIDGVITTDEVRFKKMMDVLVYIARTNGYTRLFYGEAIDERILEMFLSYGFFEKQTDSHINRYLYLNLED